MPVRTAVIPSRLYLLYANSRQSIDVKEVSHPVYLFICGLLKGALDSLGFVMPIGLIGKGKLYLYTS